MKSLLLIDGNAIIHRAYYALPPLTSKSGIPTNAVYGFFTMLHKALFDLKPTYIIVCFDTPKPNFRQELYAAYQANRPSASDDFKVQFPLIRQILDSSGIQRMEQDGFEADDVIGTLATAYKKESLIRILTGDKDIMQLVDEHVTVITPKVGLSSIVEYGIDQVVAKLGVKPAQIPDYKALSGDPSDNYKGVKGIGPKTAIKLIHEYGTIENMINKVDSIQNEKLKEIIRQHTDEILLMKKLATIVTDLKLDIDLSACEFKGFDLKMKELLTELQLNSLLNRFFPPSKLEKELPTPLPSSQKKSSQLDLF